MPEVVPAVTAQPAVVVDDEHGPFSMHPDDCQPCVVVCDAIQQRFRARMAELGLAVQDYTDMTPAERERVDEEYEQAALADEHLAAAGYPELCERQYDENGNDL